MREQGGWNAGAIEGTEREGTEREGTELSDFSPKSRDSLFSVKKAIEGAKTKNKKRRVRKIQKLKTKEKKLQTFAKNEFKTLWEECMIESYEAFSFSPPTDKDFMIFKIAYNRTKPPVDIQTFISWVVSCWGELQENELKWMKGMLPIPSVGTFLRLYPNFLEAYPSFKLRREQEKGKRKRANTKLLDAADELERANARIKKLSSDLEDSESSLANLRLNRHSSVSPRGAKALRENARHPVEPVIDTEEAREDMMAMDIPDIYAEGEEGE